MDNQFRLKTVEAQNKTAEQVLEPKRQFEAQLDLDTPLTIGESQVLTDIYNSSPDRETDMVRFREALEYSRNCGYDLNYAFDNIDVLNEERQLPKELKWSNFSVIKNYFKIAWENEKLSALNKEWMDADRNSLDMTEVNRKIKESEDKIESLRDYAPRGFLLTSLKDAIESSIYTGSTMASTLTGGAVGTLGFVAGTALAGGAPVLGTAAIAGLTLAQLSGAFAAGSWAGGVMSVADRQTATMYRQLRNLGVEKNLAYTISNINGVVDGIIEVGMGLESAAVGTVMRATGLKALSAKALAKLYQRGTFGAILKWAGGQVKGGLGEAGDELWQSVSDNVAEAVAVTISEECQKNGVTFDKTAYDVIKEAGTAYGRGFGAAIIMQVPFSGVSLKMDLKDARRLREEAKLNPSKEQFIKNHQNDEVFKEVDPKDTKELLSQMYNNLNEIPEEARALAETIDSEEIEENVEIESEDDVEAVVTEEPQEELKRMENGRLRTQESEDFKVDMEGNEQHTLNIGTPESKQRYGRVEYTINKDGTIEIDKVATKVGYRQDITKDAVLELMRRYAGQEFKWNPTDAYQKMIKAELEKENDGVLQRFDSKYKQEDMAELGDYLHKLYPNLSKTQASLAYVLFNQVAKNRNTTVHDIIEDSKAGNKSAILRFDTVENFLKEHPDKAEEIAGNRGFIAGLNKVIYVAENGDISTLFHEGFHALSKMDKQGAAEVVKAIKEDKGLDKYLKSHRAYFLRSTKLSTQQIMKELDDLSEDSSKWTQNQDEIITSMFEAYLREGRTFSEQLADIFKRIADYFLRIYRTLAGGEKLNDNIVKAFDNILTHNPELKQQYEAQEGTRFQSPTTAERAEAERQYNEVVAQYKDTDQWLKAPNGQPTKLTERQWVQVRTPLFKAWFGDWENDPDNASKVLDPDTKEPMVVYHGTGANFDVFKPSKDGALGSGMYFAESKEYADGLPFGIGRHLKTLETFLNIRNPYSATSPYVPDNVRENYDGVINSGNGFYVAFEPTQIKSATDNVGTFSQSNPSILFQTDTEYLDAVNSGDMAKAQAMVDERAREMGYNSPKLYHGTDYFGFTTIYTEISDDETSFWATSNPDMAGTYTANNERRAVATQADREATHSKVSERFDDAIDNFRKLIDHTFSEWYFGREDNSYIREEVLNADPDEVYERLEEYVHGAFEQYGDPDKKYGDFDEWADNSSDAEKIYDAIESIEMLKATFDKVADETYSGGIYELYAKTDNMYVIDAKGKLWNGLRSDELPKLKRPWSDDAPYKTRDVVQWAKEQGYDGVIFKNIRDNGQYGRTEPADVYAFLKPQSQVKSADPVTYDDNGQVIPLSQRFNDSHSSLLFQSAYHGSGASFDKFDTDFIGTGEGAQSFGWGIYLTQSEGIARSYAEENADYSKFGYTIEGKPVDKETDRVLRREVLGTTTEDVRNELRHTIGRFKSALESIPSAIAELKETIRQIDKNPEQSPDEFFKTNNNWAETYELVKSKYGDNLKGFRKWLEGVLQNRELEYNAYKHNYEILKKINPDDVEVTSVRNLYTASIPDDTGSNYLVWDKVYNADDFKKVHEDILKAVDSNREIPDDFKDRKKQILENEWQQLIDENALTGKAIYGAAEQATLDPKKASMIMADNGFVGIDYPANSMSGGNKYGKRNFVIFNADDIEINDHLRYQSGVGIENESSVLNEAKEFGTFKEYFDYLKKAGFEPEKNANDFRRLYDMAHNIQRDDGGLVIDTEGMSDAEKDNAFVNFVQGDGVKALMERIRDAYAIYNTSLKNVGDDDITEIASLKARINQFEEDADPRIVKLIKKKNLTDKDYADAGEIFASNPRSNRELLADTMDIENLNSNTEPDIENVSSEEIPTMSYAEKRELEKDTGIMNDKYVGDAEKELGETDESIDRDKKAEKALEQELKELREMLSDELTPEEMKALKDIEFLEKYRGRKDKLGEAIKRKIDNGEAVEQSEMTTYENIAREVKELEKALDKFNTKQKAKAYLDKQNALKNLRKEIKEKERKKRALKKLHDYKVSLMAYLQKKIPKSVDFEFKERILNITSLFDGTSGYDTNVTYKGKSYSPEAFREAVKQDNGYDTLTPYQKRRYDGKSLADWTVQELEEQAQEKRQLIKEGRQAWQNKIDKRAYDASIYRNIILAEVMRSPKYTDSALPSSEEEKKRKKSMKQAWLDRYRSSIPWSRLAQILDGGQKGTVYNLTVRQARALKHEELLAIKNRLEKVQKVMDKYKVSFEQFYDSADMQIRFSDDIVGDKHIGEDVTYKLTEIIYGLYAQRNERNKAAFMYGDLITPDEKNMLLNLNKENGGSYDDLKGMVMDLGELRNKRFVEQGEKIMKEHPNLMKVADAIWADWNDKSNRDRLNQAMIDEYNQGIDIVENYMPIKRLDFNGTDLPKTIADDVYNQNAGRNMTTPKKGMTKSRIDISPINQQRTYMDFVDLWQKSVVDHEHLIATNAYVRTLNRVFKGRGSEALMNAIKNTYGDKMVDTLNDQINEIANPQTFEEDKDTASYLRTLRGHLYEAYLGLKLSSFVLQVITSPFPFLREVSIGSLVKNIIRVSADPFNQAKAWKFIEEHSPIMQDRTIDPIMGEIQHAAEDYSVGKFRRGYRNFLAKGTELLNVADRWMVSAGWISCYEKKMGELEQDVLDGKMTQQEAEYRASRFADEVVLETQPTGDRTELAKMFKTGGAFRQALTQFTTSLNVIWTNLTFDTRMDWKHKDMRRFFGTIIGYSLAGLLLYMVQDFEMPDDDEDKVKDIIGKILYGVSSQAISSVPLIGGNLDNYVKGRLTGSRAYAAKKIFPAFETTIEGVDRLARGKFDKKTFFKLLDGIALFTGLPSSGTKEAWRIFFDKKGNLRKRPMIESVVGRRDD